MYGRRRVWAVYSSVAGSTQLFCQNMKPSGIVNGASFRRCLLPPSSCRTLSDKGWGYERAVEWREGSVVRLNGVTTRQTLFTCIAVRATLPDGGRELPLQCVWRVSSSLLSVWPFRLEGRLVCGSPTFRRNRSLPVSG
jgi:hypothetical protein